MPLMTPYPSLGKWVTTLENGLDNILADYILTDYDQSAVFRGKLSSLPYTIAEFSSNPHQCADEVEKDLERLLRAYYHAFDVSVKPIDIENPNGRYSLDITIAVGNEGVPLTANRHVIRLVDGKFDRVIKYSNDGEFIYEKYQFIR